MTNTSLKNITTSNFMYNQRNAPLTASIVSKTYKRHPDLNNFPVSVSETGRKLLIMANTYFIGSGSGTLASTLFIDDTNLSQADNPGNRIKALSPPTHGSASRGLMMNYYLYTPPSTDTTKMSRGDTNTANLSITYIGTDICIPTYIIILEV